MTTTHPRDPRVITSRTPCGHCTHGFHNHCPGAVDTTVHGGTYREAAIAVCPCRCKSLACRDCGTVDDVDEATWKCRDRATCAIRVEARTATNPVAVQIRACKAQGEKDRRMARESTAEKAGKPAPTPRQPARPKVGKCACCGGATKGGAFQPGHDARFVSGLVKQYAAKDLTEANGREALAKAGASEVLLGKFLKQTGAHRAKVAAAKAKQEDAEA